MKAEKGTGTNTESTKNVDIVSSESIADTKRHKGLMKLVPVRLSKRVKFAMLLISLALLTVGGVFGYITFKKQQHANRVNKANQYVRELDTDKALVEAKKALRASPNDPETLMLVANLTLKDNPEDSKQYFARALEIYKRDNDPDADGKTAINYWGAALLADQAGYKDDAKRYYQKVIDFAQADDAYHQDIAKQSREALERLR